MAALRIVRRPRRRGSLTAASAPITDLTRPFRSTMSGVTASDDWQSDAWDMLDAVGELRYYVGWRAASCSRVRLVASDIDPDTGRPTGSTENQRVNDMVLAVAGGPLGQAQYIKRAVECLSVPGEYWTAVIVTPEKGERWLAVTKEEMFRNGRGVEIELPEGGRHEISRPTDSLFRVWIPRPRRASEPDSPVRSCLDPLHEIVRTTKTISNASKSRLIGNGVVFVPQEMSLPAVNAPFVSGGNPLPAAEGSSAVQQLQELLWTVANTAYDDEDSMAALIPMFATVPGEMTKNIHHLKFDNTITEISIKVRNDAIARLAMGLDVSPERLLGLGTQSNHWSAWQIADEDVQLHIAPVMETLCGAIDEQVLTPMLVKEGIDPALYALWYDASELTADPDQTANAERGFTAGAITAEAYRDYLGLDDAGGYDYTTLEGWAVWAQDHVSAHPELLPVLAPLLPAEIAEMVASANAASLLGPLGPPDQPPPEQQPPGQEPPTENAAPPAEPTPAEQAASALHRNGRELVRSRFG